MSKVVAAILLVLIGLALIVGGYTSLSTLYTTGICLIIAGVLMIILVIKMAMAMKCETKTPTK
jgi:drug/metabolite transporter (DMT)-like permease